MGSHGWWQGKHRILQIVRLDEAREKNGIIT
jgi:hypothetical protein